MSCIFLNRTNGGGSDLSIIGCCEANRTSVGEYYARQFCYDEKDSE